MLRRGPILLLIAVLTLSGCTAEKFVGEGEWLLDRVAVQTDSRDVSASQLSPYIQQHPNSRWFSLIKAPMGPYVMSGTDSTKRINRFLQRLGEKPVIYNAQKAERTREAMEQAVRNMGFLHATTRIVEKKKGHKIKVTYETQTGERFHVSEIERSIPDTAIARLVEADDANCLLSEGMPFDIGTLGKEQARVNTLLRNQGYYYFSKAYIHYDADTLRGPQNVWLRMKIDALQKNDDGTTEPHRRMRLGDVTFRSDSLLHRRTIRESVLANKSTLLPGDLYSEAEVQQTYSNLTTLGAVVSSNVMMKENADDSTRLDATVTVVTGKPHTLNAELEGTNSSGDLGAAIVLSYQNRNLMRGSELLNVKLRGAYEAITGLDGYDAQNYIEYGIEASLAFPDLKIPGVKRSFKRRVDATSEISVLYNSQDRPEFHRRVVTGVWRYRWNTAARTRQHKVDLLEMNYVFMPWISSTFRTEYLENSTSRNAILRYNYEDLFIIKYGYTLNLSNQPITGAMGSYGTNAWQIRLNVETAGNLLYGINSWMNSSKNSDGRYTLFNIAYAQYAKADFDFAKSFILTTKSSLAVHLGLGVAYPYGNASVLPYEKRYFSGGANSVRGWAVRGLGPGSFQGENGEIDFINQTGDIKLDMNVEYRSHLFWLIDGAAFVDAGNIWTIRDYEEQPGGQFKFDTFWRQIAVAYGVGIRLNFNFFILRLDAGMKAINPAYTDSRHHYPIIHPNVGRDLHIHFAVGLPF